MLELDALDGVLSGRDPLVLPAVSPAELLPDTPSFHPGLVPPTSAPVPTPELVEAPLHRSPAAVPWGLVVASVLGLGVVVAGVGLALGGLGTEAPHESVAAVVLSPPTHDTPAGKEATPSEAAPPEPPSSVKAEAAPRPTAATASPVSSWTIRFAHDQWQSADGLSAVVREAASCAGSLVAVGHSCTLGSRRDRRLVALARAESVGNALVAAGVPADRVSWKAASLDDPLRFEDIWTGRQKMRRVELTCLSNHP